MAAKRLGGRVRPDFFPPAPQRHYTGLIPEEHDAAFARRREGGRLFPPPPRRKGSGGRWRRGKGGPLQRLAKRARPLDAQGERTHLGYDALPGPIPQRPTGRERIRHRHTHRKPAPHRRPLLIRPVSLPLVSRPFQEPAAFSPHHLANDRERGAGRLAFVEKRRDGLRGGKPPLRWLFMLPSRYPTFDARWFRGKSTTSCASPKACSENRKCSTGSRRVRPGSSWPLPKGEAVASGRLARNEKTAEKAGGLSPLARRDAARSGERRIGHGALFSRTIPRGQSLARERRRPVERVSQELGTQIFKPCKEESTGVPRSMSRSLAKRSQIRSPRRAAARWRPRPGRILRSASISMRAHRGRSDSR